jgi:cytochrome b
MDERAATARVKVWDPPTRAVHWAFVLLVGFLWWSEKHDDIANHKRAGFALISLIVFRVYWGFAGSETARFANFVRGPREIWRYLRGRATAAIGHNPVGAISVVVMLALLASDSVVGLFAIDEDGLESGPFAPMVDLDWAQAAARWHALLFDLLIGVIGVHILAVTLYWLAGSNLVLPMITGRKPLAHGTTASRQAAWWSLPLGVALAGAAFFALWRLDT